MENFPPSSQNHHHIITMSLPYHWTAVAFDADTPDADKNKMKTFLYRTQQNAMKECGITKNQAKHVALYVYPHHAAENNIALPHNYIYKDARPILPTHKPSKKCPYYRAVGNNYNYYFSDIQVQTPPQVQAPPPNEPHVPHIESFSDISSPDSSFGDVNVIFDHEMEEANQQPSPESQQQSAQSKSASSLSSTMSDISNPIPIEAFAEDVEPYLREILQNMNSMDFEEV